MRNRLNAVMITGLAVASLGTAGARADHHEEAADAPRRMVIHTDHVVPAMAEAYEDKAKAWVAAFREAGLTDPQWSWYTSSSSDFVYVTAFPFSAMADLDRQAERQAAVKGALGEETVARLNEPNGSVIRHHNEIAKLRTDLSYQPAQAEADDAPGFMRVGIHTVKPGMEQRFEELMKQVVAAFGQAEHAGGFETFQIEYGEGSYVVTSIAADAAQFYGGPSTGEILTQGVGAERTRALYDEWRECITDYDTSDWTVRADLSYYADAGAGDGAGEGEGEAEGDEDEAAAGEGP